jgi:hypothetical protein
MKKIDISTKLYPGTFALVDNEDYDELSKRRWHVIKTGRQMYVVGYIVGGKGKAERMHRHILNAPDGILVDHINGNGIDNRRVNIRLCTQQENQRNRQLRVDKSGFKCVGWHKASNKWRAYIVIDGKYKQLGVYFCAVKAAKAYDKSAIEHFGKFAKLNFPQKGIK